MKHSSFVAAVLLAQSVGTIAWVQRVRTHASTSSPEPSGRQQRTDRHLRVSLRRAGLTANSDLKDAPAKKPSAVKNLKRVVATKPPASAPAPVKLATTLADAPRAFAQWVPRRLRKLLFKPSNVLTKATAKAAHAAGLAAQPSRLASEALRLKDEAQAALAAADAASAEADAAESAAAEASAGAARARAWAAQEVASARAEAQQHLRAAEASAAQRLVNVYNDAKNSLFAGLGVGHPPPKAPAPEAPSDLPPAATQGAVGAATNPQPAAPSVPAAAQSAPKPAQSARARLADAQAAAAEAGAAAFEARAWAEQEVTVARVEAAAAMNLLLQTKAAHRAFRKQTSPGTAEEGAGDDDEDSVAAAAAATAAARAALETQFDSRSSIAIGAEDAEGENDEAHDATLQRMRRLRKSMQLGEDVPTDRPPADQ